ncbi:MAG TPA: hypothetical protein VKC61_09175 [Pyrinomonadaceae bacterium]|nr:hypothetical protein [Pyrinomonadaceae bacterium]
MKKIVLVVLLLGIAGIAGVVRSHSKSGGHVWPIVINSDKQSAGNARDEIRKSFDLVAGARVEVSGINGWVKIETSDRKTADVYIERLGDSQEVLNRRKITIESTAQGLTIRSEKGDGGLISSMFGSNPVEHVTLRLPRQISLVTNGVNGSVTSGAIDGSLEVNGVNGKVDIEQASGSADLNGINGNVSVGLSRIGKGVDISGINGNIELQLGEEVNATLEAHGMNGRVTSELPNVVVDKSDHGSYSAQIGSGGGSISANGINGNIRLTRMTKAGTGDREKLGN